MISVSVRNARLNLSKYLRIVEECGEEVIVKNHDRSVAKIVPCNMRTRKKLETAGWLDELSRFRRSIKITKTQKNIPSEDVVRTDRDLRG